MTAREFFMALIEACPLRGLDNTDIHISCRQENKTSPYEGTYQITNISNCGCNDMIEIEIERND